LEKKELDLGDEVRGEKPPGNTSGADDVVGGGEL